MIYILSFWSDIGFSIKQALRTFSCKIAAILYDFIVELYSVFMYTARAEILESEFIQNIYVKVGMILGIFMVFKLAFSLIQSLVNPNTFSDEKKGFGGIIKRSVISIILLGITPSIFRMAFDFQNLIIGTADNTDNIIYKIIVGDSPSEDAASFGHIIASELYFGFFTENEPYELNEGVDVYYPDSGGVQLEVLNYTNLKTKIEEGKITFKDTVDYLSITTSSGQYVINWDGLFAIGFAAFMIYILITYCIQVATRVIQLAYLQLVAPVPILSYISDPDGAFKNWTKQCITTYLDLFIRLAIIYFIITVSTKILKAIDDLDSILYSSTNLTKNSPETFWVSLFLILGLLMFGKRVPDLLKDLFPNFGGGAASLGFGLKSPKKLISDIPGYGFSKKVIGYTGKGLRTAGGFAWKHTGAKGIDALKNVYNEYRAKKGKPTKEEKEEYKKQKRQDDMSETIWGKYGPDFIAGKFAEAFKSKFDENSEYAKSYQALENANNALKAFTGDTNSAEYRTLLADKEKAQKNHDLNRQKYGFLASREDQLKRYANRHPEVKNKANQQPSTAQISSNPSNITNQSRQPQQKDIPINQSNSMFANMSDEQWQERQAENSRDEYASKSDPNDYFDKMNDIFANEYVENDGVSDEFNSSWEAQTKAMEESYKKAGWVKGNDGKWSKPQ